ncbi:MAG: glycosyltransferase family 4 protein, partial [Candidatus Omnitrophica bacterium]|nr:glycosyltransferase family 4 protein [Candidatus Omnitrophota bacterium]
HGVNIVHVSSYQFPGTSEIRIPIHIFNPWRFLNTFSEISRLAYNSRFVRNTLKIAAKTKPDIIYQRYNILNYSGVTLARHLKIPFILEIHSFATWTRQHWSRTKGRFLRSIHNVEMLNLKAADLLIVVSEPLRKDLINLGIDEKKILVNPIGVDPQKFNPEVEAELRTQGLKRQLKIGSDKVIVGFAGSFGPWHGIPELTEAIYEILSKHLCSNACFLLIGDGQYRADTEKKLRNYENVIFTGQVPYTEIQYYLAFCNILVVPNNPPMHGKEFFGSPTKMFEYMAMGKAIVASNLGQIGLVLENSKTAILVEPGNIRELINGILMLVKDGNLRENLGKNARKKVIAEHTWKENTKRVMEAVQRL